MKREKGTPRQAAAPTGDTGRTLRRRAEELFREKAAGMPENRETLTPEEVQQTLHELRVHQIELEMQNEELQRTQGELEASRARYFDLYDLAPVGYFTLSEAGLILEVNLTAAALLDAARSHLIKKRFTSLVLAEDQDTYYLHRKLLFETGAPQVCELRLVKKSAAPFWVRFDSTVAQDADGASVCRATMIDITEKKQAEDHIQSLLISVQTERNRLSSLINSITDEVWFADPQKRFTLANPSARRGFCIEPDQTPDVESLAKNLIVLCPDGSVRPAEEAPPLRALSGEVVTNLEEIVQMPSSGEFQYREVNAAPVRDSAGRIIGAVSVVRDITEKKQAEKQLRESLEQLRRAVQTTIQVLVMAVELKDPYTAGHQRRMTGLARTMATEMGLPPEKIEGLRLAGVIHDIGKITLPTEILSKPNKLTNIEWSLIKEHVQLGYDILKDVESSCPLAEIVRQHHERLDGSGYPRNLKGEEILIEARILAVADVVEAMASHRPYRPALGLDAALEEIEKNKGLLYDSNAVDTCLRLFREKGYHLEVT